LLLILRRSEGLTVWLGFANYGMPREIVADSKLFLTERNDETNSVKCFNLRAADVKENLEA
jgi:hypothetical protein